MTRGNNAQKLRAREIRAELGEEFCSFEEAMQRARTYPDDAPRNWVITPEIRAVFDGHGVRGIDLSRPGSDLDSFLRDRSPAGECGWCEHWVDSRTEPISLQLFMTAYDPDLSPVTMMMTTKIYHTGCKESGVSWSTRVAEETREYGFSIELTSGEESVAGDFAVTATAVVNLDDEYAAEFQEAYGEYVGPEPVLCLNVRVEDDYGSGVIPWLHTLGEYLGDYHLGNLEDVTGQCPWSVRVLRGYRGNDGQDLVFVREELDEDGEVEGYFYRGSLDRLPDAWVDAARQAGQVLVACGPLTNGGEEPEPWDPADPEHAIGDLIHDRIVAAAYVPIVIEDYQPWPHEPISAPRAGEEG